MVQFLRYFRSNEPDYKIDLVYLWCEGSDPDFIEKWKYYQKKCNIAQSESNCEHNYVNHEELRYSLRSVFKNAPWINKIYIVTNGQIPKWLDLTKTDKIEIVTHEQIMPKGALPTFHSDAIELCVANIPGLEEHFLLANDDTFINAPVTPDFFFDSKGNPIVRLKKVKNSKKTLKHSVYSRKITYTNRLINKLFNKNFSLSPHHNIDAYRKSIVLECTQKYEKEFAKTIYSKFRKTGVQRLFFSLYAHINYKIKIKYIKASLLYIHSDSISMRVKTPEEMIEKIKRNTPTLLCLNDHQDVSDDYLKNMKTFMEYLYPDKQCFENDDNSENINRDVLKECCEIDKKYNFQWKILRILELILSPILIIHSDRNKLYIRILSLIKISKKKNSLKNSKRQCINLFGIKIKHNTSDYKTVTKNYEKVLQKKIYKKIKKNQPINVIFLSNEISKWGFSHLYKLLDESHLFEPKIVVYPLLRVHLGRDDSQPSLKEQYDFYKNQGFNVEYGYNGKEYLDLSNFSPDIIFYPQARSMPEVYKIAKASKIALSFYISYSFDVIDSEDHYLSDFHRLLFTYFTESKINIERFERYKKGNSKNCFATGYPKLDAYLDKRPVDDGKYWKEPEKFKIIYAPHHSFEENGLHLATFTENGKLILELAKAHPETTWVFKPHPRFQFALLKNKIMTQDEINEYYRGWESVGNIVLGGNYIDLFRTSDLMITDCGSFLGEYLPSKKPLIQLVNPRTNFNELGKKVKSEYYFSHDNDELKNLFEEIVVKKLDYKKEAREKLSQEVFDFSKPASEKIFDYLNSVVLNMEK